MYGRLPIRFIKRHGRIALLPCRRHTGLALFAALLVALLPTDAASAAQEDYGAIAWSRSTGVMAVGFAGSVNNAAQAAIVQCQANGGGSDCAAYGWFYQGYAAFAHGNETGWGFGWGTDAGYADTYAIQYCQQNSSDNSCQIASRTQTPGVAEESPSATGGTFSTPITTSPTPTYQPPPRSGPTLTYRPATPARVPGATTWLAVLLVVLVAVGIAAVLVARILRQAAQRRHWHAQIRVKSTPDSHPSVRLQEPGKAVTFAVRVEVHPDHGLQTLQEAVTQ
ncbi:MAG: DUF4189 domain-containing protein [Actinomycetota bacterium]|nr:DUF4189 domain-containing protein [Actinomycetota bacterium]